MYCCVFFHVSTVDATRVGVIIGSAFGGMDSFEKAVVDLKTSGPSAVGPYTIPMILGNTAAGIVGMVQIVFSTFLFQ